MVIYGASPGEIESSLGVSEIIDIETQKLFDLQHHYYGEMWIDPAPTEGEIFEGSAIPHAVAGLAVFGELAAQIPGRIYRMPAYGLRTGLRVPSTPASVYARERTIHQTMPTAKAVIAAGLGYVSPQNSANDFGYRLSLYREGSPIEPEWTVQLHEQQGKPDYLGDHATLRRIVAAPDDETMKRFLQLFREVAWASVNEPA